MRFVLLLLVCFSASAQSVNDEIRYCRTAPLRDADGSISRDMSVVAAFRRVHPCPVTGKTTGACRGWAIDHVIPLVCGGCDAVYNLQWLPNEIKSARGKHPKDRWEQKVYCTGGAQ